MSLFLLIYNNKFKKTSLFQNQNKKFCLKIIASN